MKELLNSALGSSFFGQPLCLSYDNSLSKNSMAIHAMIDKKTEPITAAVKYSFPFLESLSVLPFEIL